MNKSTSTAITPNSTAITPNSNSTSTAIRIGNGNPNFSANTNFSANVFPNSNYIPDQEEDEKELKHEQNDENQSTVIPQTTSKEQEKSLEEILELLFGNWQTRGKDGKSDPSVTSVGNQKTYKFTNEDDVIKFAEALEKKGIACKLVATTKNKDGTEQIKEYASVKEYLQAKSIKKGIKINNPSEMTNQTISSQAHNKPKSITRS